MSGGGREVGGYQPVSRLGSGWALDSRGGAMEKCLRENLQEVQDRQGKSGSRPSSEKEDQAQAELESGVRDPGKQQSRAME